MDWYVAGKSEGWFEVKKNGELIVTPMHTAVEKGKKKQGM